MPSSPPVVAFLAVSQEKKKRAAKRSESVLVDFIVEKLGLIATSVHKAQAVFLELAKMGAIGSKKMSERKQL